MILPTSANGEDCIHAHTLMILSTSANGEHSNLCWLLLLLLLLLAVAAAAAAVGVTAGGGGGDAGLGAGDGGGGLGGDGLCVAGGLGGGGGLDVRLVVMIEGRGPSGGMSAGVSAGVSGGMCAEINQGMSDGILSVPREWGTVVLRGMPGPGSRPRPGSEEDPGGWATVGVQPMDLGSDPGGPAAVGPCWELLPPPDGSPGPGPVPGSSGPAGGSDEVDDQVHGDQVDGGPHPDYGGADELAATAEGDWELEEGCPGDCSGSGKGLADQALAGAQGQWVLEEGSRGSLHSLYLSLQVPYPFTLYPYKPTYIHQAPFRLRSLFVSHSLVLFYISFLYA